LNFIESIVNRRVLEKVKALVKVRYVSDTLELVTLREWADKGLKDFTGELAMRKLRLLGIKGLTTS